GSSRRITFGGEAGATIAVGALVVSDPVELAFAPLSDLAVSVYLPDDLPASFGITGRYARQTNYISPPGDFSAAEIMPVGRLTDDWYFVSGIDVVAPRETGAVVALGDSLTDANISTHDGHHSWPSQLARRLMARQSGRPMAVMNQGLGGNRILHDIRGDSGLRRFDRDVLAQPGVTHAVIMLGTNDLRNRSGKPEEEVTTRQMIGGLKQFAVRGQARGIQVIVGTLIPFENETFLPARGTRSAKRFARKSTRGCSRRTRSTRSSISIGHCAIRTNRPGCYPSTIAAITFTRAISAIARWATRSISRCSRSSHEPRCAAHDSSRRRVEQRALPRRRNHGCRRSNPAHAVPHRRDQHRCARSGRSRRLRAVGIAHRASTGGRGQYRASDRLAPQRTLHEDGWRARVD